MIEVSRLDGSNRVSRRQLLALVAVVGGTVISGCGQLAYRLNHSVPADFMPNPLELPPLPDDFVWSQVVDTLDDYFRVAREQPVQNSDGIILDGRLETAYQIGASLAEPWRKDSTAGFERLQSTLQSIRRRAIVTVRPQGAGYMMEVIVQKDLEDTDRSQFATEIPTAQRHDGTIIRRNEVFGENPETLGWIPLGRDTSLEQAILHDIFARLTQADRRLLHDH